MTPSTLGIIIEKNMQDALNGDSGMFSLCLWNFLFESNNRLKREINKLDAGKKKCII